METDALLRRGLLLEYLTLGWNVVAVGILALAAVSARSVALAGFGLDSLIEIGASMVVIWQLRNIHAGRERRALFCISVAFSMLAIYVSAQIAWSFLSPRAHPGTSLTGILWVGATVAVMAALAAGKRASGRALDNPVLLAEARVTLVDACLAASVLLGISLNALVGWWWADPAAGLFIVVYGAREGRHTWLEARHAR